MRERSTVQNEGNISNLNPPHLWVLAMYISNFCLFTNLQSPPGFVGTCNIWLVNQLYDIWHYSPFMSNYETQSWLGLPWLTCHSLAPVLIILTILLSVYNASSTNLSPEYDPIKDWDNDSEYGQWEVHDEANRAPNGSPEIHHISNLWFLGILLPDIHPTGT